MSTIIQLSSFSILCPHKYLKSANHIPSELYEIASILEKDDKGNIYDANGTEAMNIADEKLVSYLGENARVPTNEKVVEQSEEEAEITTKISVERSTKYEEHKKCLIEFNDNDLGIYTPDTIEMLTGKVAGLEIKKSSLEEFMRDDCNLTFEKATFWSESWLLYQHESKQSMGSQRANDSSHDTYNKSIYTYHYWRHIIYRCGKFEYSCTKAAAKKKKDPKCTTAVHYLRFLSETLGIMVKHDQMKDFYQTMDNAPVYLSK
ncbi:hypothetical protein G6F57_006011 [Rhizopus arrhizus]|uniref:Uncharacterized protein n=1 Tax=Rhizopus oryzae TaxID=64495 RepID=A0A9P7BXJ0_RHIOR|nr:hypothetical protein G6F23_002716 [Rhizopus arrhizus]KAG1428114.1 hypothetical protein G6F58_000729 [Rhizopus delemar]KAG0765151.1 hypothetical protein G6F24_004644 [Rhizopus arrhizus]KAG0790394.1 hypothetical protein G6F21_005843 [Rhizopus arrhizus]KAG0798129.1 hypothetical protein G6F22_004528 [Rhizopus arrhizus]